LPSRLSIKSPPCIIFAELEDIGGVVPAELEEGFPDTELLLCSVWPLEDEAPEECPPEEEPLEEAPEPEEELFPEASEPEERFPDEPTPEESPSVLFKASISNEQELIAHPNKRTHTKALTTCFIIVKIENSLWQLRA
jgi:hypothetical protein